MSAPNPETRVLSPQCPFCGKNQYIEVPLEGLKAYQNGELMQNAFPDLSADDREALISGVCPSCWEKTFEPK